MANRSRKARRARLWMAVAYVMVVAIVLAAAYSFLRPALVGGAVGNARNGRQVYVEAYMSGFSTFRIDAKVGEPITIKLRSMDSSAHLDGGGKHQLAIDEFGVNIIAPPKGVSEFTFTPDRPGTYLFYCSICCGGKANPTMRGEFVVTA